RAFTRATGITPLTYQRQLRLERARTLLVGTGLTVEAVAARCGFRDARQLRRLITETYGAPPSRLRTQLRLAG
ncbi:helix-turn-helix domain-containing protein, partial [Streptomyces sp. NPDC088178]